MKQVIINQVVRSKTDLLDGFLIGILTSASINRYGTDEFVYPVSLLILRLLIMILR